MSRKKSEGNLYDKIFKENAERIFMPLVEQRLGVRIVQFKPWREKLQRTVEREMDFFYQVLTDEGRKFLLHLEFQSRNNSDMIYRSAEYHGISLRRKKMPIRHVVIYLGLAPPTMMTRLPEEHVFTGFELVSIHHDFTADEFLSSQVPETIILAVLAYYDPEQTEAVLRLILRNLKRICKDENELSKYLSQLIVLSRLRNLQELTVKTVNDMPITFDIETDYLYRQGLEKGIALEREHAEQERRRAEEEHQRADEERQRAEAVERRAEEERQRAEAVERRAEEERQRAEAVERRAEEERQRAEEEKRRAVFKMLEAGVPIPQIADFLSLPVEVVENLNKSN
jgi:hypothetical protein